MLGERAGSRVRMPMFTVPIRICIRAGFAAIALTRGNHIRDAITRLIQRAII